MFIFVKSTTLMFILSFQGIKEIILIECRRTLRSHIANKNKGVLQHCLNIYFIQ